MKKSIYLLEDDKDIKTILEWILEKNGFEVQAFQNVHDFNKAIRHSFPDLFILDIMLPDGNGIDVCSAIKQDARTHHVPVLLMSANVGSESISKCKAQDFIAKPFDINYFMNKVLRQIA